MSRRPDDITFALNALTYQEFTVVVEVLLAHQPAWLVAKRNRMSEQRVEELIGTARPKLLAALRRYDDQYHPLRREAQHGPDALQLEAPDGDDAEA